MRIPITFPFHDPPAQEKRYKEERERREMRFGDRVGGQLLEKASGEMREDFSSPRTNPVPISRLYSPNTMSAPSPQHHRHEDAMRDLELKMTFLIEHRIYIKVVFLRPNAPWPPKHCQCVEERCSEILKVSICGGLWKMIYRE